MDAAAMKEIVRMYNEEMVFGENPRLELMDEILSEDYVRHAPGGSQDLAAFRADFDAANETFSDASVEVLEVIAEGDLAAARWVFRGTFNETDHHIEVPGMSLYRFEGDRMAESWSFRDRLDELEQMGLAGEAAATE